MLSSVVLADFYTDTDWSQYDALEFFIDTPGPHYEIKDGEAIFFEERTQKM